MVYSELTLTAAHQRNHDGGREHGGARTNVRAGGIIAADIAAGPDAAVERSLSAAIERSTAPVSGNFLRQLFAAATFCSNLRHYLKLDCVVTRVALVG